MFLSNGRVWGIVPLTLLLLAMMVGCETYGPYELHFSVDDKLVSNNQRFEVDLVGTRQPWELTMEEYYSKRAEELRESGRAHRMSFDAESASQTLSSRHEIWKLWKSKSTRYLYIVPHLQSWRGRKGEVLDLSSKADGRSGKADGFDIVVYETWAKTTPFH